MMRNFDGCLSKLREGRSGLADVQERYAGSSEQQARGESRAVGGLAHG